MDKEILLEKYKDIVQELCLMDDIFFEACFADFPEGVEYILRIILDKKDLRVVKLETQHDIENLYGHAAILDVFATDSEGKNYQKAA